MSTLSPLHTDARVASFSDCFVLLVGRIIQGGAKGGREGGLWTPHLHTSEVVLSVQLVVGGVLLGT